LKICVKNRFDRTRKSERLIAIFDRCLKEDAIILGGVGGGAWEIWTDNG